MAGNKRGRRRRMRVAVVLGLLVVAAVAGFLTYRGLKGNSATEVSYNTAPVQKMTLTSSVSGTGSVELSQAVTVQPEVSGTVSGLAVKVGDRVEAGQLLFTIVNPDLDLAVTKAEIAYQEALLALDKAKLSVLQAKQNLADLEEQYEAQSTTTTTSTTLPVSSTTSTQPMPTSTTTVPSTTSCSTTTTIFLPGDTSSTTSTTGGSVPTTDGSPSSAVLPSEAVSLLVASGSANTPSQSGSSSGSSSSAEITELDLKAAKQAVESAELSVASAEVQVTSAELALQQAKENAAKREVRAPMAGVVTAIAIENGDTVGQGGSTGAGGGSASAGSSSSSSGVMTITDPEAFTVKVALPESDISVVKVGQKATITLDALPDLTLTGKVTSIDLTGTNSQGVVSYGVVVTPDLTDPSVKAGMTATVNIITKVATDVLAVPSSAVKSQGGTKYVQVLENGAPVSVTVEVGMSTDSYVEITSGLAEGQEVVVQTVASGSATTTTLRNPTGGLFNEGGAVPGGAIPGGFVPGVR